MNMYKVTDTHTGRIFVDPDRKLEFLAVGDYGKENNLKADFLGLTKRIEGVEHFPVDYSNKLVVTISTQKGCSCKCNFCDVPKVGYHGNATADDLWYEIASALWNLRVPFTKRLNIHFARMGEPTYNPAVLSFTHTLQSRIYESGLIDAEVIHPVVSTMMPKHNKGLQAFLLDWCYIKNVDFVGEAGLQLSINSTDDAQRNIGFNGLALSLDEVSKLAHGLPDPDGRKYTLNFAVTKDSILEASKLDGLFDRQKFIVKLTPIHQTTAASVNGYDITNSYERYDVYEKFERPLTDLGWDVIVFVPSKEEDADRITCGNALLADSKEV
jgi:23S rRNA (adenine2503-C2)-methyltransferase